MGIKSITINILCTRVILFATVTTPEGILRLGETIQKGNNLLY